MPLLSPTTVLITFHCVIIYRKLYLDSHMLKYVLAFMVVGVIYTISEEPKLDA